MPNKKTKQKILLISGFFLVLLLVVLFSVPTEKVNSQGNDESCTLSAWAWSGYKDTNDKLGGIGWTSFTHLNQNDSVEYGVTVEEGTGLMTGYIWSPSIGWIRFGGLSDFPTGSGTTYSNAKLVGDDLKGWIRACSVLDSNDCSGTTLKSNLGGWDGWIALSGNNWGVTYNRNNKEFTGFGWGGPKVVGWFDFIKVGWDQNNCDNGGDFAYTASIPDAPLFLYRDDPNGTDDSKQLKIVLDNGTAQEVEIVSITAGTIPDGDIIQFDIPSDNSCVPTNEGCFIDLIVGPYQLRSDGGNVEYADFTILTRSIDGSVSRETYFDINIIGTEEPGLVCSASPSPAFRDQDVSWLATPFGGLEAEKYVWFGDADSRVNGLEGEEIDIVGGYQVEGVINAGVRALDDKNLVITETECLLQVLPDIYFQHI